MLTSRGLRALTGTAASSKNRTRIMGTLACCEEIRKEKERSLSRLTSNYNP